MVKSVAGLFLCALLSCAAPSRAQSNSKKTAARDRPDFTGTWVLDASAGNYGRFNPEAARGGVTLVVTHREPEITVTRKFVVGGQERTQQLVYYTDGRGESNPAMTAEQFFKSKTKWSGRKLVTTISNRAYAGTNAQFIDTEEKWELSADGDTLTLLTSTRPPPNTSNMALLILAEAEPVKKVFRRAP